MKSKMFLAIFMMSVLFTGGMVSYAATAKRAAPADYLTGGQSMARTERTTRRKKSSKLRKGAVDVEKGTKDTGRDIGKGSEKAGEGVAKGTEVGAKETATVGKDVGKDTTKVTRKAGNATARGVKKVGSKF
jgi:hypothetical protein